MQNKKRIFEILPHSSFYPKRITPHTKEHTKNRNKTKRNRLPVSKPAKKIPTSELKSDSPIITKKTLEIEIKKLAQKKVTGKGIKNYLRDVQQRESTTKNYQKQPQIPKKKPNSKQTQRAHKTEHGTFQRRPRQTETPPS